MKNNFIDSDWGSDRKRCRESKWKSFASSCLAYSPTFFCLLPFSLSHIFCPYLFPPFSPSPLSSSLSHLRSLSRTLSLSLPPLPYLTLSLSPLLSLTPSLLNPLLISSLPISQRSWGVPIPVFYKKSTNEALMNAEILEHVEGTYYLYGML